MCAHGVRAASHAAHAGAYRSRQRAGAGATNASRRTSRGGASAHGSSADFAATTTPTRPPAARLGLGVTGESPGRFPGEVETRPVNLKLSNDSMASRGRAGRCEVNADDVPPHVESRVTTMRNE